MFNCGSKEEEENSSLILLPPAVCLAGAKLNGFEGSCSFFPRQNSLFCSPPPFISQEPFGLRGIAMLIGKRLLVVCHRLVVSCNKRKNLCTSMTSMYFSGPSCIFSSSLKSLLLLACKRRGWQHKILKSIPLQVSPPANGMFSGDTDTC